MNTRFIFNLHPDLADNLHALAKRKNVSAGEILRRAFSLYTYVLKEQAAFPEAALLLQRGDKVSELVMDLG